MLNERQVTAAFGKAVRSLRTTAGISQENLAAIAGVNRSYLGDVERGQRNISVFNMQKIATALNLPLSRVVREMEAHLGG